jgi:hypothetical protein
MRVRASLALLLTVTGCTTTYKVPKTEISRLDGWFVPDQVQRTPGDGKLENPESVQLKDTEGRGHTFTEDTPLVLVQRDGSVIAEKFLEVSVDEQHFRGVPQDAFRRTVEIPLSEVKSAGISEVHVGRTALLLSGIAVGLAGAIIGVSLAIGDLPKQPSGDPCGESGCQY